MTGMRRNDDDGASAREDRGRLSPHTLPGASSHTLRLPPCQAASSPSLWSEACSLVGRKLTPGHTLAKSALARATASSHVVSSDASWQWSTLSGVSPSPPPPCALVAAVRNGSEKNAPQQT
eukprot:CAMPEP_0202760770 /NCGR_PEP_ID=MMETSP1388-20130828/18596_1 /ASSEMBLY_ACC=CAM_ASM_000864 /TAXON_ID=37098 /ORGANISM="Isochrysis sp, Strain CCMP1244" /LENGTH=120 /DNA_ID=CAMNT_0049428833 /DNA_START=300 /DNA_END=659 /DNA_ORIENTATION=-